MTKTLTWDLLVHPFYFLGRISFPASEMPKVIQNADAMNEIWRQRITSIKNDPTRGMIILPHVLYREEGKQRLESIIKFAQTELGKERCVVLDSDFIQHSKKIHSIKALPRRRGKAMGEYLDSCVGEQAWYFTRVTSQPLAIPPSRSVSTQQQPLEGTPIANLAKHLQETIRRARRTFGNNKPK